VPEIWIIAMKTTKTTY